MRIYLCAGAVLKKFVNIGAEKHFDLLYKRKFLWLKKQKIKD